MVKFKITDLIWSNSQTSRVGETYILLKRGKWKRYLENLIGGRVFRDAKNEIEKQSIQYFVRVAKSSTRVPKHEHRED